MQTSLRKLLALMAAVIMVAAACGSGDGGEAASDAGAGTDGVDDETSSDEASSNADADAEEGDRPTVVVTTNILGDVVTNLVGDAMDVVVIMPVGADPHSFQPSAQQVDLIASADVLLSNGGGFEEGLIDIIEAAESDGVPTFQALDAIDVIEFEDDDHDHSAEDHDDEDHGDEKAEDDDHDHSAEDHGDEDHGDEDHGDEDHGDEDSHDGHDHGPQDPHFFTDPARMAIAAQGIAEFLIDNVDGVDAATIENSAAGYIAELEAADAEVEALLATIPADRRVLVTNHEVFGYFADRYGFEVVGTVIPSGSTTDGVSAGELAELAEVIEAEGVPAIFGDISSSEGLVDTLAEEVGSIDVVEIYSESLGEQGSDGATYLDMIRSNAQRITAALAG